MSNIIRSSQYRVFRREMKAMWQQQGRPCAADGQPINYDGPANDPDSFELDHIKPRKTHPHLALEPSNAQPMHARCNRAKGSGAMMPTIGETTEDW